MKKMLSGLLMLAMFLSLSLAGWSAPALAEAPADRAGSYVIEELYMDGEDYTEAMKTQGFTVTLELYEDGTARMESSNMDETLTFRWDAEYFIYDSGEKTPYEYQDGVIRMEEDGSIMVFRKLSGDAEAAGEPAAGAAGPAVHRASSAASAFSSAENSPAPAAATFSKRTRRRFTRSFQMLATRSRAPSRHAAPHGVRRMNGARATSYHARRARTLPRYSRHASARSRTRPKFAGSHSRSGPQEGGEFLTRASSRTTSRRRTVPAGTTAPKATRRGPTSPPCPPRKMRGARSNAPRGTSPTSDAVALSPCGVKLKCT